MAPVLESATTSGYYGSTVNKPSGAAVGDVLVAFVYTEIESGPPTPIAGFTLDNFRDPFGPGGWVVFSFQYRIVDGGEGSSFALADNAITLMGRVSGANVSDPIGSNATYYVNNSTSSTIPSVTTAEDDALLLEFGHFNPTIDIGAITVGGVAPDFLFSSYANANHRGFVHGEVIAAAGATGTRAVVAGAASNRRGGMIALNPAGGSPPAPARRRRHGLLLPV